MRKVYRLGETEWKVVVWWDADCYDAEDIGDDLIASGARGDELRKMMKALREHVWNQGMTYVNERTARCVVVIGKATTARQYANTIAHEVGHLGVMLADAMGIALRGERLAYLLGDVTEMLWGEAHRLTCPKCGCEG